MELVDTHCHIHSNDYGADADEVIAGAVLEGVTRMICVGTDAGDSKRAVEFAREHDRCWASFGIHPHEAANFIPKIHDREQMVQILGLVGDAKVVAIGECGLDYYYDHSPKADQQKILRFQLELAVKHDLPVIFHVREAFSDFWPIFDEFPSVRGVIHSFTDTNRVLEQALSRGLYIGLNGIMTFTKDQNQLEMACLVPLEKLLLETDAPYLTPKPFRGTICQPKYVRVTAEFLADLRGESLGDLANSTSINAGNLFGL